MKARRLTVETGSRCTLVDVTAQVRGVVRASGITDGMVVIASLHTTAGVTVQENADPDVVHDLLRALADAAPARPSGTPWRHAEGNADAHVKAAMVGTSVTLVVEDGEPLLGTWQAVYLCEFDGPRTRTLAVRVVPDDAR